MKQIPLNTGRWKAAPATRFALIDDGDFELVRQHKWTAVLQGKHWYARTMIKRAGCWTSMSMHRLILGFPRGLIDHRNQDGLDNQRKNLRPATKSQNAANSAGHRDRACPFKGVCFDKQTGRWLAQLRHKGEWKLKARFDTPSEAATAYAAKEKEIHGRFAPEEEAIA